MSEDYAIRIRRIRESKNETMEEFGKRFDPIVSKSVISNWENSRNKPSKKNLEKIAEIGNTSVDYILYGDKDDDLGMDTDRYLYRELDKFIKSREQIIASELKLLTESVYEGFLQLLGKREGNEAVTKYMNHREKISNIENFGKRYIEDHYENYTFETFLSSYPDSSLVEYQLYKEEEWNKMYHLLINLLDTYDIAFNDNIDDWINNRFTSRIRRDLEEIREFAVQEEKEDIYINELVQPILDEAAKKIKEINSKKK